MATEKIERQVVSTSVQEQSKATYKGWELTFISKSENGISVSMWGAKEGNNVNANISESGSVSISFTGSADVDLATQVFAELEAMRGSEE